MGAVVEKLLSRTGHAQIVGVTSKNENELVGEIWHFLPDIIIMTDQSQISPTGLLSQLTNYHSLRLVVINETCNSLDVYEKRHIETKQLMDFTTAVHT
jgi:hypothetical protein